MRRTAVLFGLCVWAGTTTPRADEADSGAAPAVVDVIQMLADLTAIDQDCRSLSVDYGVSFRFAAAHGVPSTDVLPTGPKRAVFEKDLNETEGGYDASVICGALAQRYSTLVPGSVSFAPPDRDP